MITSIQFGNYLLTSANGVTVNLIREKSPAERALMLASPARARGVEIMSITEKSKVVEIEGVIMANGQQTYIDTVRNFSKAIMQEDHLYLVTTDGTFIYEDCVVMNPENALREEAHYNIDYIPFRLQFLAPAGVALAQTSTNENFLNITTSPYTNAIEIDGTAIPDPIITTIFSSVGSGLTSMTFLNRDTNEQATITTTYVSGDTVIIDTKSKQVSYNTRTKKFAGVFPRFVLDRNRFRLLLEAASNIHQSQTAYNNARSIYASNWLGQKITPSGNISVPQIDLMVKKVGQTLGTVEALVVGGGGGGGKGGNPFAGGGGGAGGYLYSASHSVVSNAYAITVGAGGTAGTSTSGGDGGNSVFDSLTAIGGGGGGGWQLAGRTGGSGGGGGAQTTAYCGGGGCGGGAGTSGQGYNGGPGDEGVQRAGGGGGAGGAGTLAPGSQGGGGAGVSNSISGSAVTYCKGGNGGTESQTGTSFSERGSGGGGGQGNTSTNGGAGTAGIVIIRYLTASFGTCTGGTITTNGAYTIHTFTSSGTFTVTVPTVSDDLQVEIQTDSAGVPSGTAVANGSATVDDSLIGEGSFSIIPVTFATMPALSSGTVYHIVCKQAGGDINNYYSIRLNTAGGYSSGNVETSTNSGGAWTAQNAEDLYFAIYATLPTGINIDMGINYYKTHHSVA